MRALWDIRIFIVAEFTEYPVVVYPVLLNGGIVAVCVHFIGGMRGTEQAQ